MLGNVSQQMRFVPQDSLQHSERIQQTTAQPAACFSIAYELKMAEKNQKNVF